MRKLQLVAAGLLLAAIWNYDTVTAAVTGLYQTYAPQQHEVVVNPGGSVFQFIEDFTKARERGDHYRVTGLCVSACTLILGQIDRDHMCATPHALFGFHAAFTGGFGAERKFSKEGTELLWQNYPPAVQAILKSRGWTSPDVDQPTLIWVKASALKAVIPPCRH